MNAQEESERAETPLPALEPLDQNSGPPFGMLSPPYDVRGDVNDGYESVDSMPDLQSVSNDDEDEDAMRLGDRTVLTVGRIHSIEQFSESLGRRADEPVEGEGLEEDVTESDTPVLGTSTEEPRLEPPFITDGRGRVVWTSPAEEDTTSRPAEEENGGEPAGRPEAVTESGGLLGWFNALF
jgi:E3 ubiquitin-protein ligase makorin